MSFLTKIVEPSFRQTLRFNGELNSDQVIAYVHSMEGDIYLLEIESPAGLCWVQDPASLRPKRFNSLANAKGYARDLGVENIQMAFQSPYEEMIGL